LSCAICETRKEKRFCPAVHGRICPQCCGTEREVTLDCPSECPYLQQARSHEKLRSLDQLDQASLLPEVTIPEHFLYENEQLLVGLSFALVRAARTNRAIADRDLVAALSALAQSYSTMVNSGLVYEVTNANILQQAVTGEIQKILTEFRQLEQQHLGYSRLKDSEVLRALVFLLRMGQSRTSGRPKSRAFIDTLFAQFPDQPTVMSPEESGSRIILP